MIKPGQIYRVGPDRGITKPEWRKLWREYRLARHATGFGRVIAGREVLLFKLYDANHAVLEAMRHDRDRRTDC
jgi:hypothetical protein